MKFVRLADEGRSIMKAQDDAERLRISAVRQGLEAIQMITSGITTYQSTGSRVYLPFFLSHLSRAHAGLGQFDEAWRCIGDGRSGNCQGDGARPRSIALPGKLRRCRRNRMRRKRKPTSSARS